MDEMLQAIEAQVQRHVDQHLPRFQGLINEIEDILDTDTTKTPIVVRTAMYEIILTELLGKFVAAGAVTMQHPLDKVIEGVATRLKAVAELQYNMVLKYQGEHNVHANSVGEELSPDKPNP